MNGSSWPARCPASRKDQTRQLSALKGGSMMISKNPTARAAVMLLTAAALVLSFASAGAGAHGARLGVGTPRVGACEPTSTSCVSTIAFASNRDHLGLTPLING